MSANVLRIPGKEGRLPAGLPPLTTKQLRDAERDQVYIFNVAPREHRVMGPDRMYVIPPRLPGQRVSDPLMIPGAVYTTGVKRVVGVATEYEWITLDGEDVAADVIGTAPFKDHSANLVRYGVFASSSPDPTEAQISAAEAQWLARCDEVVREADAAYQINGGRVDIGDGRTASNIGMNAIQAAAELGIERPWSKKNLKMSQCGACGIACAPDLAFCPNGCVMDYEKAKKARPWQFAHEKAPRRSAEE